MREKMVDKTFEALYALEDMRGILRKTAPFDKLTESQKEELLKALRKARAALDAIESDLK